MLLIAGNDEWEIERFFIIKKKKTNQKFMLINSISLRIPTSIIYDERLYNAADLLILI